MRRICIIVLLLYSCSPRQESGEVPSVDSVSTLVAKSSRFDSLLKTTCRHTDLSHEFDIEVLFKRHRDTADYHDSCVVKLSIADKNTRTLLDSMSLTSLFYFDGVFKDCSQVRSYTTKVNADKLVSDNYYGDIVIADLNFDDREDIAVINDSGGNGGTFYSYYLQEENRRFIQSRYLTDSMVYFPSKINKKARTLVTYVHAGACGVGEHVHQLNQTDGRWGQKSHRIIGVCK